MIQPIVVDTNNCLIAGAHRKAAIHRLYKKDLTQFLALFPSGIPCYKLPFSATEEPEKALQAEITENEIRRNYTREEINAVAERLKQQGYTQDRGRGNKRPLIPALQVAFGVSRSTILRALREEESNVSHDTFDSDEPHTFNPSDGEVLPASGNNSTPPPEGSELPAQNPPKKTRKKKTEATQTLAASDPETAKGGDTAEAIKPMDEPAGKGIALGQLPTKAIPSGHLRSFSRNQLTNIRNRWIPALQMLSSTEAELRKEHERLKNAYNHVEKGKTIWTSDFRDVVAVWDEHQVFQDLAQAIGCRNASFSEILNRMEFLGESVMIFAQGMRIFTGVKNDGK